MCACVCWCVRADLFIRICNKCKCHLNMNCVLNIYISINRGAEHIWNVQIGA